MLNGRETSSSEQHDDNSVLANAAACFAIAKVSIFLHFQYEAFVTRFFFCVFILSDDKKALFDGAHLPPPCAIMMTKMYEGESILLDFQFKRI